MVSATPIIMDTSSGIRSRGTSNTIPPPSLYNSTTDTTNTNELTTMAPGHHQSTTADTVNTINSGWDVYSMLTVPCDVLRKVTRERKTRGIDCLSERVVVDGKRLHDKDTINNAIGVIRERVVDGIGGKEVVALEQMVERSEFCVEEYGLGGSGGGGYLEEVLIPEYLARRGYLEALKYNGGVGTDNKLDKLTDVGLFEELYGLVSCLVEQRRCGPVLEWCERNEVKLKKMKSGLPFQLHVQEFVGILQHDVLGVVRDDDDDMRVGTTTTTTTTTTIDIKKNRNRRAMEYAKKYMAQYAHVYPEEFQRAASLLVLRDILPECSTCTELFSEDRWSALAARVTRDFLALYSMQPVSPLELHVRAGIASLKTTESMRMLIHDDRNTTNTTTTRTAMTNNPLSHPVVLRMASGVPYSKRTVSRLVCPITGMIMEGANAPMVLPNGYVYGRLGLFGGENDDEHVMQKTTVVCPCTLEVLPRDAVRRAYIV